MTMKMFAVALVVLAAIHLRAEDTPKTLALSEQSTFPSEQMRKFLKKQCPEVVITDDTTKSDFVLEATTTTRTSGEVGYNLVLSTRDHWTLRMGNSVKDICQAIRGALIVEVVDNQNLTQSQDTRGNTSGGAVGTVVNGLTGRRTHTDNSLIYVIVNGEHAVLDCYERRKGCTTIGPGRYHGDQDGKSIWVVYKMPLTHEIVRNHYKIAGSW
jgi:hypothetical protein